MFFSLSMKPDFIEVVLAMLVLVLLDENLHCFPDTSSSSQHRQHSVGLCFVFQVNWIGSFGLAWNRFRTQVFWPFRGFLRA